MQIHKHSAVLLKNGTDLHLRNLSTKYLQKILQGTSKSCKPIGSAHGRTAKNIAFVWNRFLRHPQLRYSARIFKRSPVRFPYPSAMSQKAAAQISCKSAGAMHSMCPRSPALTWIRSYSCAVSSIKVEKCFFMPSGEQPPRT